VYWNATIEAGVMVANELHSNVLEGKDHLQRHRTLGALLNRRTSTEIFTLTLGSGAPNGNGNTNSHAQFALGKGSIYDEDILLHTDDTAQVLTPIFAGDVIYRLGTAWAMKNADNYAVIQSGAIGPAAGGGTQTIYTDPNGHGKIAYNQIAGTGPSATGALVACGTGVGDDYVNMHVGVTNDIRQRVRVVCGQQTYSSVGAARTGALVELHNLYTIGLPMREWVWIYSLIFGSSNAMTNAVKATIRSDGAGNNYYDWRNTPLLAVA
jgi:hypothetical protein